MGAPRFLLNSCDGSQDPIIAILDISEEDFKKIREGILTSAKIDGLGCFTFVDTSEEPGTEYNFLGLYSDCSSCSFGDAIDEFKSNPNVSQKFEDTRSEIQTIIQDKLAGGK
jgi:hypothetical protein